MELADNQIKVGAWVWTNWPTAPLPSVEWIRAKGERKGPSWVDDFHRTREEFIARERHDPLQYGWEQPPVLIIRALLAGTYLPGVTWRNADGPAGVVLLGRDWKQEKPANDILGLGGNGSAKTDIQGKLAMETLAKKGHREARMFSQNEMTSQRYIQKAIARYLPPELRRVKRDGQVTKISYAEATGFSENIFVLPNHSVGLFPTYKGWEQDKKSVEGGECHVLTWDEEMPADLVKTVRFRAHKTGGFLFGGFTPVEGYTDTVREYLEGGTVLEFIPARAVVWDWWARTWTWGEWLFGPEEELVKGTSPKCPKGHVPFVVQSGVGGGRRFAVIMPTMFNPYTNVEEVVSSSRDLPKEKKLERLWGWATNLVKKAFPRFGEVHEVEEARMPKPEDLTIILWADPHGQRNWFMAWLGVDGDGNVWILKEWPDPQLEEWALPGKNDGKVGPAQAAGGGRGFNDYKRIILQEEGWEFKDGKWQPGPDVWTVSDRRLDPRPAGTSVPSDEEARTYLDYMNDAIEGPAGAVEHPGLDFAAGPACGIEEGNQLINDALTRGWDPDQAVTPLNCPKLYVCRQRCPNIIWALRTYTGADGEKGACKDPIDVIKGPLKLGLRHVAAGSLGAAGGGGGY